MTHQRENRSRMLGIDLDATGYVQMSYDTLENEQTGKRPRFIPVVSILHVSMPVILVIYSTEL